MNELFFPHELKEAAMRRVCVWSVCLLFLPCLPGCESKDAPSAALKDTQSESDTSVNSDGDSGSATETPASSDSDSDTAMGTESGSGTQTDTDSYEPSCGDGIQTPGEVCDDGNTASGDGCTANCLQVEEDYVCPKPGEPCLSTVVCGDAKITGAESCDDGNDTPQDGCGADCNLEAGWVCPFPGLPCRAAECGDGIIAGLEECEYKGGEEPADGGGCSRNCEIEENYDCDSGTLECAPTHCGNKVTERGEQCDDGNAEAFDGCYRCRLEPDCRLGVCKSSCGDGQRYSDEECDDGNLRGGDGCSADCRVEPGFYCSDIDEDPPAQIALPVKFRDFVGKDRGAEGKTPHRDFNRLGGSGVVGIPAADLDANGRMQYNWVPYIGDQIADGSHACTCGPYVPTDPPACTCGDGSACVCDNPGARYGNPPNISTPENFAQWYWDDPEADLLKKVNLFKTAELVLERNNATGTYLYDSADTGDDGISHFDPFGPDGGWIALGYETPTCSPPRNVSFTSETHFWFEYKGGERFDFSGDDDTWVFLNGRLAIDLGGLHTPRSGYFILDGDGDGAGPDTADGTGEASDLRGSRSEDFGLVANGIYEVVMFQAERNECGSNFKVTLKDFDKNRSRCASACGDGIVSADELCDDGPNPNAQAPWNDPGLAGYDEGNNSGAYGKCAPNCKAPGPYCGDGVPQNDQGEECDDGVNLSQYGGCAPGCVAGPYCGDGTVQSGFEFCDDGTNDGSYGTCDDGCVLAPHCGDGVLQEEDGEECDDGNHERNDGCSPACKKEVAV